MRIVVGLGCGGFFPSYLDNAVIVHRFPFTATVRLRPLVDFVGNHFIPSRTVISGTLVMEAVTPKFVTTGNSFGFRRVNWGQVLISRLIVMWPDHQSQLLTPRDFAQLLCAMRHTVTISERMVMDTSG